MRHSLIHRLAPIVFATAGLGQAATAETVAEIVTFRLGEGVETPAFLSAAAATEPFLTGTGKMISRTLSVDDTGLWTDFILWTSMDDAKSAAEAAMQHPSFGPFMQMIAADTVEMRHAPVLLQIE